MRPFALAAVVVALGGLLAACARGDDASDDSRRNRGGIWVETGPAGGAVQGPTAPSVAPQATPPGRDRPRYDGDHPRYDGGHRDGWRRPDCGFGYDSYWPYGGYTTIYPSYVQPYWQPLYPPPLFVAPRIITPNDLLGGMPGYSPPPARPAMNIMVVPDRKERDEAPLRATNAESMATGRKFIAYGDAQFVEQEYAQAHLRYKKAAVTAPQLAQAYFRQGWALVASGRYELAVAAFKKGLDLDPDWPTSEFRLDQLYGPNRMAKTAHIDALAAAAAEEPDNPDLLFLVGVFLFFDGQPQRARPFFERMTKLPAGAGVPPGGFLAAADKGAL